MVITRPFSPRPVIAPRKSRTVPDETLPAKRLHWLQQLGGGVLGEHYRDLVCAVAIKIAGRDRHIEHAITVSDGFLDLGLPAFHVLDDPDLQNRILFSKCLRWWGKSRTRRAGTRSPQRGNNGRGNKARRTACTLLQRREAERMARPVNIETIESPWISGIFAALPPAMLPERVDI